MEASLSDDIKNEERNYTESNVIQRELVFSRQHLLLSYLTVYLQDVHLCSLRPYQSGSNNTQHKHVKSNKKHILFCLRMDRIYRDYKIMITRDHIKVYQPSWWCHYR